jgi:hypothetical protein
MIESAGMWGFIVIVGIIIILVILERYLRKKD